jgi:hypothetical protein
MKSIKFQFKLVNLEIYLYGISPAIFFYLAVQIFIRLPFLIHGLLLAIGTCYFDPKGSTYSSLKSEKAGKHDIHYTKLPNVIGSSSCSPVHFLGVSYTVYMPKTGNTVGVKTGFGGKIRD